MISHAIAPMGGYAVLRKEAHAAIGTGWSHIDAKGQQAELLFQHKACHSQSCSRVQQAFREKVVKIKDR